MHPRMDVRVPLDPQVTPPRRRTSVATALLELPVHVRASGAVVGQAPWRDLRISRAVVERVVVVGWRRERTGRGAAHVLLGRLEEEEGGVSCWEKAARGDW